MVASSWRGRLAVAGGLTLTFLPSRGLTDCSPPSPELLILEPVSLETDGVVVPEWLEAAAAYEMEFGAETGPDGPYYLVTGARTALPSHRRHEAFDAMAGAPR